MRDGAGARASRARRRPRLPEAARAASGRPVRATQNDPDPWRSRPAVPALQRSPESGPERSRQRRTRTASVSCFREEVVQRTNKIAGHLDMRAMPGGKLDQLRVQESCELSRTRDRYGIECAVHDTGCGERDAGCEIAQRRAQIIVVQAVPYGLLGARGDSKLRQGLGVVQVTEIACDRELEGAPLVRGWIPFPPAAHAECVAVPPDFRRRPPAAGAPPA